jgi:hypothetical protein
LRQAKVDNKLHIFGLKVDNEGFVVSFLTGFRYYGSEGRSSRGNDMDELPFQTYERIIGLPWPGGESGEVATLLRLFGITAAPGSACANLELQEALKIVVDSFPNSRVS